MRPTPGPKYPKTQERRRMRITTSPPQARRHSHRCCRCNCPQRAAGHSGNGWRRPRRAWRRHQRYHNGRSDNPGHRTRGSRGPLGSLSTRTHARSRSPTLTTASASWSVPQTHASSRSPTLTTSSGSAFAFEVAETAKPTERGRRARVRQSELACRGEGLHLKTKEGPCPPRAPALYAPAGQP